MGLEEAPARRVAVAPGTEAQIDFGTGALVTPPEGGTFRPHLLRGVPSHSRKAYSEVFPRQATENFIGTPSEPRTGFLPPPVIDNPKAGVKHADFHGLEPLAPFDWSFDAGIDRKLLHERVAGPFVPEHRDVLFLGPSGVGKSCLAQALGLGAIQQSLEVPYPSIPSSWRMSRRPGRSSTASSTTPRSSPSRASATG